jgi:hypothetical protein
MKLTSSQVQRTLSQFEAEAIPDGHPAIEQLCEVFGDHTFFLDANGLNIVEPAEGRRGEVRSAQVVNIASWGDSGLTSLAPHEPEPTETIVALGSN